MPRRLSLLLLAFAAPAWAITGTTTTLKITSNGNIVGGISTPTTVVLTATVSASGTAVTPGQVKFCDNSINTHCTGNAYLGLAQLTTTGKATFPLRFGYGTHSLQAIFLGTKTYSGSQSTANGFVQRWKPGVAFSHITSTAGSLPNTYNLSASLMGLAAVAAPPTPTGTVSFLDTSNGNSIVASAALVASAGPTLNFLSVFQPLTGKNPTAIAVADFNHDGIPDVAVANTSDLTVSIFLGSTNGTYFLAHTISVPAIASGSDPRAFSILAADFNGDGNVDLLVSDYADTLSVLLGNGDGTFQTPIATNIAVGQLFAVADFNGDGVPDFASLVDHQFVHIDLGNGDGTFADSELSNPQLGGINTGLAVGDLNNDGIPDLVVSGRVNNGSSLAADMESFLGNGDGTFTWVQSLAVTSDPFSASIIVPPPAIADLNGDGKPDIVLPIPADSVTPAKLPGIVAVLLGTGDGRFGTAATYPAGNNPSFLAVADMNLDGIPDVIAANDEDFNGSVSILSGNGDGTFQAPLSTPVGSNPIFLAIADANGDGKPDVIVLDTDVPGSNPTAERLSVLLNWWGSTSAATANNVSIPGTGMHNIEAYFPGDSNYRQATSATIPLAASGP